VVAPGVRHDGVVDLLVDGQHAVKGRSETGVTRPRLNA
jgi:hypothetical protein